jgi:hypothetical protein
MAFVFASIAQVTQTPATCLALKSAYQSSSCCGSNLNTVTSYAVDPVPQNISYTYTTDIPLSAGVQTYQKIRSATCGYADLMGAVFSDATILTEVPQFYSFLSSGYITDAAMTSPDACEAQCTAASTCQMFYYQYEWTNSSRMVAAGAPARWLHKCQLTLAFSGTNCGSPFAGDAVEKTEHAGRVSAAGSKSVSHNISYTYTTDVTLSPGTSIQTYQKIRSATCGYANLMGAVFSDATILTEVPQFYSFLSSGYITDAAMMGPEACEAHCTAASTCQMFYYQYEWTNSSRMVAAGAPARWLHKCQLTLAFSGTSCGSPFAGDAVEKTEHAGRVSAAGSK